MWRWLTEWVLCHWEWFCIRAFWSQISNLFFTQNQTSICCLVAHPLTILQIGVQGSSPELLSVDQEINVLQCLRFSKHFVSRTSFSDVFFSFRWLSMLSSHLSLGLPLGLFPFRWLSMLSSHLSLGLPLGLFPFRWLSMLSSHLSLGLPLGLVPFIFNFITTLSVDSSSVLMTWPNHQSLFLFITWTMGSILLCLYRSSFLFLPHLVTHCIILNLHVCCCNLLF